MDPVIAIHGLTKRFGGKTVLNDLTLTVPRGAICALLGANGAGKTTTIRILTGLLKPDRGRALILGHNCWAMAARLRQVIGYVPERPKFYDWMTVAEIGWFAAGFHHPRYLPRYEELIVRFDLDPKARLANLSKGEYAKVGLALALAVDPEVLILDEPTSGLDLLVRREFLGSMVELAGEGKTIFISSHQVAEVERVASHVAFLSEGRLLLAAPMDELRERIVRVRLRFESDPPNPRFLGEVLEDRVSGKQWQAVVQNPNRAALDVLRRGEDVYDFEETPLALEEVYCALMGKKERQP
jgi:ABC-2 type transport system ATP-binding protein